jgi:hypothetical protein
VNNFLPRPSCASDRRDRECHDFQSAVVTKKRLPRSAFLAIFSNDSFNHFRRLLSSLAVRLMAVSCPF